MRLCKRALFYTTLGAGVAGITSALLYGPDEFKRQLTSNGIVRVGRAAGAVSLNQANQEKFAPTSKRHFWMQALPQGYPVTYTKLRL